MDHKTMIYHPWNANKTQTEILERDCFTNWVMSIKLCDINVECPEDTDNDVHIVPCT
jgi:hypothetical protein